MTAQPHTDLVFVIACSQAVCACVMINKLLTDHVSAYSWQRVRDDDGTTKLYTECGCVFAFLESAWLPLMAARLHADRVSVMICRTDCM
jgi:hypothetical protein